MMTLSTRELIDKELEQMARHKWIQSEKVGYDLGEKALLEWAELHSEDFLRENGDKFKN